VGIYGVIAQSVVQRTREADILQLEERDGLALTLAGIGIGVAGALALSASDPASFAASGACHRRPRSPE